MINSSQSIGLDSEFVLDEVKYLWFHNNVKIKTNIFISIFKKMVLIGLLQKHFFDNLKTEKFPSHVITVRKHDILDVKEITCYHLHGVNLSSTTIDLSNLQSLCKLFYI